MICWETGQALHGLKEVAVFQIDEGSLGGAGLGLKPRSKCKSGHELRGRPRLPKFWLHATGLPYPET